MVHGLHTTVASLVESLGFRHAGLSSCSTWAELLPGVWDPPRPQIRPVSPALASRLLSTCPLGELPKSFVIVA